MCASCLATFAVWTAWLALLLLFAFQVYIASVNELQIPRFLLRAIEDHLAESGVTVRFGRATFDPSGRILLQRARFKLASFNEPIVTADAIYIRLDPLALLERRFEAREIRATGANLFIPAMLSASGRAEKVVQDLDAGFSITSRGDEFSVDYMNCRLGEVCVSAHGRINAGTVTRNGAQATSLPLTEFVAKNYVALSREFARAEVGLAGLDRAVVTALLTPSDTRGAIVNAELFAEGLSMAAPMAVGLCRGTFFDFSGQHGQRGGDVPGLHGNGFGAGYFQIDNVFRERNVVRGLGNGFRVEIQFAQFVIEVVAKENVIDFAVLGQRAEIDRGQAVAPCGVEALHAIALFRRYFVIVIAAKTGAVEIEGLDVWPHGAGREIEVRSWKRGLTGGERQRGENG